MNVFVLMTASGEFRPFIAATMTDAITEYEDEAIEGVVGVFLYGSHDVLAKGILECGL